jgi:hypothetical protein
MKKILLLMLLTIATMASAEGRYTIINANEPDRPGAVYIFDTEKGNIRFCYYFEKDFVVPCTDWTLESSSAWEGER